MARLRGISGAGMILALERLGFRQACQRGSHVVLKKHTEQGEVVCVVPLHSELAIGTVRGILRQAHLKPDEFMAAFQ